MKRILTITPARGFVFILSLGLLLWGLWVGNPYVNTFDVAFYSGLKALAAEGVWSACFITAALTMMYGIIRAKVDVMAVGAMFGFILWGTLAALYGLSDLSVTPTATNSVLALAHGWAWLCIKNHPRVFTERMAVLDVTGDEFADFVALGKRPSHILQDNEEPAP